MNDFQKDNAERMAVYQQNVTEIADFIHRRRENPYFSLNEKSLPCVGSERSERPNRANLFRVVG